ncbi:ribonuclease H-like domain-containing protein, partial [Tanacetum coccineum]
VPHPLSGDYTPKPQEEIDDSLYVYGPQKPETSVSDDNSSEHSTCQSNDSEGSCGNTSEHFFETESESLSEPNEMSKSRLEVTNEKDVSAPKSKEVEPSWEGYSFTKKKCFVCGSLSHLIKDCDYYEKKMAREAEVKRVVNTGNGVAKPVWTNANRINHANKLVPRSVQLNTGRTNINSVRPKVNSVRPKVNAVSPKVNTVRPRQPITHKTSNSMSPKRPQMNQINQRRDFSKSYSSVRRPFAKSTAQMAHSNAVMGSWGSAVKTSASYNWRNSRPNFNYNSGPTFIRTEHPLKNMVDRGIFDSGCSGHMTGNKDQLEDFEEFNGGSVTFGGSKGYISGKGRIRVGNLDFDSVSFVKELGHFNLFSISQICDKQHKVLFTETECLVVSSDFKMPDENQILLKVPRHHNMYSFDMKTPSPAKGFACLIAKATSDESKLWHRRLGHINFKNLNKLVKGNLVRGLPSKYGGNQNGKLQEENSNGKDGIVREYFHQLLLQKFKVKLLEKERKAKKILLMAIPRTYERRFHGMDDAKEIWGSHQELGLEVMLIQRKMQKISTATFSNWKLHGAEVSYWKMQIISASKTSSSAQNVAFVSQSKSIALIQVKSGFTGAYNTCTSFTSSTNVPEKEVLAGFADEVIYSLFAQQSED